MRIHRTAASGEDPINMTPMIDMVFLLLIFFLVATTFATDERDITVQLPVTSQSQPLSAPPRQLIINIKEDGQITVSAQAYDKPQLAELLGNVLRNNPDKEVLIRADRRSLFQHYADVVSICRHAGVNESKLGYLEDSPSPVSVK